MTNEHSLGDDQKKAPAEEANWLPSNVQLGECREKVEQIRMLNQLMWLHSNESTTDASVNRSVHAFMRCFVVNDRNDLRKIFFFPGNKLLQANNLTRLALI